MGGVIGVVMVRALWQREGMDEMGLHSREGGVAWVAPLFT
jgi:hypothetical protein